MSQFKISITRVVQRFDSASVVITAKTAEEAQEIAISQSAEERFEKEWTKGEEETIDFNIDTQPKKKREERKTLQQEFLSDLDTLNRRESLKPVPPSNPVGTISETDYKARERYETILKSAFVTELQEMETHNGVAWRMAIRIKDSSRSIVVTNDGRGGCNSYQSSKNDSEHMDDFTSLIVACKFLMEETEKPTQVSNESLDLITAHTNLNETLWVGLQRFRDNS